MYDFRIKSITIINSSDRIFYFHTTNRYNIIIIIIMRHESNSDLTRSYDINADIDFTYT